MTWVKRIAFILAGLLLGVAALLWWLLGTGAGLRLALARVQATTDGALQVRQARGQLAGPLDLAGVRYDDGKGTVVRVAKLQLDLRLWPLLAGRVQVSSLDADGVEVSLPASTSSSGAGGYSLRPPLDLLLDRVRVGTVKVSRAGSVPFASNRLELSGRWTRQGIELKQFALQAADGHAELAGKLAFGNTYRGNGTAAFAWKLGDTDYAGELVAHGDGDKAHFDLKLRAPAVARLQIDLVQRGDYAWTARVDAPRFDPRPVLGDGALTSLAVTLQGKGDRHNAAVTGKLDINDYPLQLQPLRVQLDRDYRTLTVQQLALSSPRIAGRLDASGTLQLAAKPLSGKFDIHWRDVMLPAELAGQRLASQGQLGARGSAQDYHAEGAIDIGPPGRPARLALNLDGNPQAITLHTLALKQAQGGLQASGSLTLQPVLAWQARLDAHRFDPGQLFAGWSGALDADIASHGSLPGAGPDASVEIRQLSGTLRQRAIGGSGQLHLSSNQVLDGSLRLTSGRSKLQLDARPGASNDVSVQLLVASLGDWLPDAGGRLDGHFSLRGRLPKLSVNGQLHGQALRWQQRRADRLRLIVGIPDLRRPAGKLDLQGAGVLLQGLYFQQLELLAEGSQGDHVLKLDARGGQLSGTIDLHGALKGTRWNGTLSTLDLQPQGMPGWRLQQPATLSYHDGAMSLQGLCLTAGAPQLCVAAKRDRPGNLDASYRLHALPLALLLNAAGDAGLPLRADGVLDGDGRIHRRATGALSGTATIQSSAGSITDTDRAGVPPLRYRQLRLHAELGPGGQHFELHGGFDQGGQLDGQLGISGAQQALSGRLELQLDNLAFAELLSSELANVKGHLSGSFRLAGTLRQPAITGQASVGDFAAELPAAGLKLSQGRLTVSTGDAGQADIEGSVSSGKGTLGISGHAGIGAGAQAELSLKGSRFTAVDIPAARVVVSPDLTVQQDAAGVRIAGGLAIDSAEVNVDKLPGAGAARASRDVVVVDEQQPETASQRPVNALVRVDLGQHTRVIGRGLDGQVSGILTVSEQPGRGSTGQGQIAVNGSYRAFGQKLQIQRGQLLFASTPIDNPGLNIRAIRKLNPNATIDDGQQVGLYVAGTAQRPVLTVFSDPPMEQSDALSYLITGKPLSEVKSGQGSMVGAAEQALGSATGNLLARSIGSRLGIDDIGVSSNDALGGGSAFTVGKYLSPRLYLSYGVGLFEPGEVVTLRYRLGRRWNFEAQQATEFSRASLNYRIEK